MEAGKIKSTEVNKKSSAKEPKSELFYVLKDNSNFHRLTVWLKKYENCIVRGIAICSKEDKCNPELGKVKAEGRAKKAFIKKCKDLPINRNEAIRALFKVGADPFRFKSDYNIILTPYEIALFEE